MHTVENAKEMAGTTDNIDVCTGDEPDRFSDLPPIAEDDDDIEEICDSSNYSNSIHYHIL